MVFPAPLGPMRKTISPSSTWKLTSFVASSPPNRLFTFSNSRMRAMAGRTAYCCAPMGPARRRNCHRRMKSEITPPGRKMTTTISSAP